MKANKTRIDKIKKLHRAIKDIKYARNLGKPLHTWPKKFDRNFKHRPL